MDASDDNDRSTRGLSGDRAPAQQLSDDEVLARLRAVARVGRFTILRQIGAGGMGTVSLAYDEKLDRKVAIKMIRARYAESQGLRRRFLREGQALARLSHPNIVTIYEVGEHLGLPFLAMELVDGCDLETWLKATERSPAEILRFFCQAGRGLAAAHRAGIIHRDFKPANVLVGGDGQVRVVDFGLARAAGENDVLSAQRSAWVPDENPRLTAVGAVLGTPAYMAPEQLAGAKVDSRCDQYSFGVALYEALCGERPVAGRTFTARSRQAGGGARPELRLPKRVRKILQRALDADPEARYPSMEVLIAELSVDPWRWWKRSAIAITSVGLVAAASLALAPPAPCSGGPEQLGEVWSEPIADELRASLGEEGERLLARLGDYASTWIETDRAVCMSHQSGQISGATLDVRMRCLDGARMRLGVLVEMLRGGVEELEPALKAVHQLPPLTRCRGVSAPSHGPPPLAPEFAEEALLMRQQLARINLWGSSGDAANMLGEASEIVDRAIEIDAPALVAEALLARGRLRTALADYRGAAKDLEDALWRSEALDEPEQTANIMGSLVHVLDDRLGQKGVEARWRAHADALIERVGHGSLTEAKLAWAFGSVAFNRGDSEVAIREFERAVEIAEAITGPDSLTTTSYVGNLGIALTQKKDYEGALFATRRALAGMEAATGPDDLSVIAVLWNIAGIHLIQGDNDEAVAVLRDAFTRIERSHGSDHPQAARIRESLGLALRREGDDAGAKEQLVLAEAIMREHLGPHREHLRCLRLLLKTEISLGEIEAARAHGVELIDMARALYDEDDPQVLEAYGTAAEVEFAAGPKASARSLMEEALALPLARSERESPETVPYLRYHMIWSIEREGQPRVAAELAAELMPVLEAVGVDIFAEELAELARIRRRSGPASRRRRRGATRRQPR